MPNKSPEPATIGEVSSAAAVQHAHMQQATPGDRARRNMIGGRAGAGQKAAESGLRANAVVTSRQLDS